MKRSTYKQQGARRLLTGLLGVAACFATPGPPASAEEDPPVSSTPKQTGSDTNGSQPPADKPAVPAGASGMTVHIDPQTGRILREPAPGTVPLQLTPQQQNALSTSHQGLVEVPASEPGGGTKIDLQGRFQSPLAVTIDANGKLKMQHLDRLPESGDKE